MTFVKTKLLIEKMKPLETAEVRLSPGEPLENVPRSVVELGHAILDLSQADPANPDSPYRLLIRKAK